MSLNNSNYDEQMDNENNSLKGSEDDTSRIETDLNDNTVDHDKIPSLLPDILSESHKSLNAERDTLRKKDGMSYL